MKNLNLHAKFNFRLIIEKIVLKQARIGNVTNTAVDTSILSRRTSDIGALNL